METEFLPSKRTGLAVILLLCAVIIVASVSLILDASQFPDQPGYPLKVAFGLGLFIPLFWLIYRAYELISMRYVLARGGLALRWGLRREIIPMPELEWIRPVSDFEDRLPLPLVCLPGCYLGKKQVNGLGLVEFTATDRGQFLLVAAHKRYFVISPKGEAEFLRQFERLNELGTLEPFQALSESFSTLWERVWQDRTAKKLIQGGLGAALLLLVMAVVLSVLRANITWVTLDIVPSQRLFLLAVLGMFVWFVGLWSGFFFYLRSKLEKTMIYLLWGASIFTSLVLAIAMLIMSL
ncbi:MAG: PH domain-containing protein [Anaerolineaceae bacterium]